MLIQSVKFVHWNDLGVSEDALETLGEHVTWGDAAYTLVPVEHVISCLKAHNEDEAIQKLKLLDEVPFVALDG